METQAEFVNSLIAEVNHAVFADIEDIVAFVKWLDDELCFLVRIHFEIFIDSNNEDTVSIVSFWKKLRIIQLKMKKRILEESRFGPSLFHFSDIQFSNHLRTESSVLKWQFQENSANIEVLYLIHVIY